MRTISSHTTRKRLDPESGQASIFLLIILGIFLLGSVAFAVDLSNMWFRRSAAQTAADASCAAGALDMLYLQNGTIASSPAFTPGTAGDCFSSSTAAICKYAGFNGHAATASASSWGSATSAGAVAVNWTFPASVSGVTGTSGVVYPFLKVSVQENVATWFIGLLGIRTQTVGASCTCGLAGSPGPAAIVVLNPVLGATLNITLGAHIVVTGGPQTSIQVNSAANGTPYLNSIFNAVSCAFGVGYPIDTSAAGPAGLGGNLAIVGGPTTNQYCGTNYIFNANPHALWKSGAAAIPDPYASVPAPNQPSGKVAEATTPVATVAQGYIPISDPIYGYINGTWVASGTDSCPNTAAQQHYLGYSSTYPANGGNIYGNCLEFTPGYYPYGINTTLLAANTNDVVIFMPGIYYLNGGLVVAGATTVRNAWIGTQPSTNGVMFYFLSGGPLFAVGSGGATSVINPVPSYYLSCSSSTTPSGMPTTLTGNVLASQCATAGTYVGAPSSDTYSGTGTRGLLFFSSHTNLFSAILVGAGAALNFSGSLYFHNNLYLDFVELDGVTGATTYAMGSIVADELNVNGPGTLRMVESTSSATTASSVGFFQ